MRLYDPALGRFIARDRLRQASGYLYVNNDPLSQVDPDGNQPVNSDIPGPFGTNTSSAMSGSTSDMPSSDDFPKPLPQDLVDHFFEGSGSHLSRNDNHYNGFMQNHYVVAFSAKNLMERIALERWHGSEREGTYAVSNDSIKIDETFEELHLINFTEMTIKGSFYVNRESCTVRLYDNRTVIQDNFDANKYDIPLVWLKSFGLGKYFSWDIHFKHDDIEFQFSPSNLIIPDYSKWPYTRTQSSPKSR